MSDKRKVIINLATGLEDAERVLPAFLIGHAALQQGKEVLMFLTKEAVRLAVPGHAVGVACDGCPPLARVFQQFADDGGTMLACPFCWTSRGLQETPMVANASVGGATPMWKWVGDADATVFSF